MVRKTSGDTNFKDMITYQSVGKLLIQHLRQEFQGFIANSAAAAGWTPDAYVEATIQKLLESDSLRPTTDYIYEAEVKTKASQAAVLIFQEAAGKQPPANPLASDADLLKAIDAYLKRIQDEKKASREQTLKGTARSLSPEELAKYASVKLSSEKAKAFSKEVDNKLRKKS